MRVTFLQLGKGKAALRQCRAVVGLRIAICGYGNCLRIYCQSAVNLFNVSEVGSLVLSGGVLNDISVINHIGSGARISPAAARGGIHSEAFGQARSSYGAVSQGCAIVCLAAGRCRQSNLRVVLRNSQCTQLLY